MISIAVPWEIFKQKSGGISYAEFSGNYCLYRTSIDTQYTCVVDVNSPAGTDFHDNFKEESTSLV